MTDVSFDLRAPVIAVRVNVDDAWWVALTLREPDPTPGTKGDPMDLTGWTFTSNVDGDATVLQVRGTDLPNGLIHYGTTAATTGGGYEIRAVDPGGLEYTKARGQYTVDRAPS